MKKQMNGHVWMVGLLLVFLCAVGIAAFGEGVNGEEPYPYDRLSDNDMRILKDRYKESLRYNFEQRILPDYVFVYGEEFTKGIYEQEDRAKEFTLGIWNRAVIMEILDIQVNSEDVYLFPGDWGDEEVVMDKYTTLTREAGLEASDHFDVSFETLDEENVMLLLSFHKTDTPLACKYIGVVVNADSAVRYLTAEAYWLDVNVVIFCELTADVRGSVGAIGPEKNDFVDAVRDAVVIGQGELSAWQHR